MAVTDNIVDTRIAKASGHFGEWIQGRIGDSGPVGLISVQCPHFWVRFNHQKSDSLVYENVLPSLSKAKLEHLLDLLNRPKTGLFTAHTNMAFGAGLGASTASLLAAALSVVSPTTATSTLAKAINQVEGASDPLMYAEFDRLLWASRTADILDRFAPPPRFTVLGGTWGEPQRTDPADENFPDISDLLAEWRTATNAKSQAQVAEISTESFGRTTKLRGDDSDPTLSIARDLKALGVIRAHTGSARGILFEADEVPHSGLNVLTEAGYSCATVFQTGECS